MNLGIGIPSAMPFGLTRSFLVEWARNAEQAGFYMLGTLDWPNQDAWEPLPTLAAVAMVTDRIRLATAVLRLPTRNPVLLAKQAAVVDLLSGGRLDLGVGMGLRREEDLLLGVDVEKRVTTFRHHVNHIRSTWRAARLVDAERGAVGPAPYQQCCPIWVGADVEKALFRGVELGDGVMFSARTKPGTIRSIIGPLREKAVSLGKRGFRFGAIAYVAIGENAELKEAMVRMRRFYPASVPDASLRDRLYHGSVKFMAELVANYATTGLDVLILFPWVANIRQVEALATDVLPAFL